MRLVPESSMIFRSYPRCTELMTKGSVTLGPKLTKALQPFNSKTWNARSPRVCGNGRGRRRRYTCFELPRIRSDTCYFHSWSFVVKQLHPTSLSAGEAENCRSTWILASTDCSAKLVIAVWKLLKKYRCISFCLKSELFLDEWWHSFLVLFSSQSFASE